MGVGFLSLYYVPNPRFYALPTFFKVHNIPGKFQEEEIWSDGRSIQSALCIHGFGIHCQPTMDGLWRPTGLTHCA